MLPILYLPRKSSALLTMSETIFVAVVDRHVLTREATAQVLNTKHFEIAAYASSDDCRQATRQHDVIVCCVHGNISQCCCANIKDLSAIAPVAVLCDVDCVDSIVAAFAAGARGYIPTTDTTIEMLVNIIFLLNTGGTYMPVSSLSPRGAGRASGFTSRQEKVLGQVKEGKTNKIIAYELEISESAVKFHIQNLLRKLNATNRTELVVKANAASPSG